MTRHGHAHDRHAQETRQSADAPAHIPGAPWYLAAAQGRDTIEVSYLDGVDKPYMEQQEGFTVDGVAWKVRLDAAPAIADYRGIYKNPGNPAPAQG